jgi:outer membrane protein assembly factor BamB
MKINFTLTSFCGAILFIMLLWACKKDDPVTPPQTNPVDEEVIPGVNVGYGAELLEPSEYEKIKLIQEPQIAGGRIQKDVKLLPQYDLSAKMPPVQSQGIQGSCVAWAVSYAARSYFKTMEGQGNYLLPDGSVNQESVFSPAYVYNQIKVKDCATGSYVSSALSLLVSQGVCTWKDMPYDEKECSQQPSDNQKQKAGQFKIKDWGRIQKNADTFRKFLYYDMPIVISGRLNDDFRKPSKGSDGQFVWKNGDNVGSGHAMVIVGYDDNRKAFKIQNSWGNKWCNNGYIWMNYDILEKVIREAYIMIPDNFLTSVEAPVIVTDEAGAIQNGQIEMKGHFNSLGVVAIIRYGICVSNTNPLPVDQVEVKNKPLTTPNQAFTVMATAVGPKLYYRAFAETLQGIVYGNVLMKEIKTEAQVLDKSLLFANAWTSSDPLSGKKVAEIPQYWDGLATDYAGITLSKTHYLYVNSNKALVAVGIADNQIKWKLNLANGIFGYPVTDGKVVCYTDGIATFAIDLITGAKKWEYRIQEFPGQPVIKDNHVYVGHAGRGISMINVETGKLVREFSKRTGRNIATVENGVLYYITATGIIAYNVSTGATIWEYDGGGYFNNFIDGSRRVLFSDGKLITAAYSSHLGTTKSKIMVLNASDGKVVWEKDTFNPVGQRVLTADAGSISYTMETEDLQVKLVTLDMATGRVKWERKIIYTQGINRAAYYTPLLVGSTLIFSGQENKVFALSAANGSEQWVINNPLEVGNAIPPSLITKEGRIYHPGNRGM